MDSLPSPPDVRRPGPSRPGVLGTIGSVLQAALIAFAAALGMLLGFGRRSGTLWQPLNSAAHTLLGGRADGVWGFVKDVTPVGCLVVLTVCTIATLAVVLLVPLFPRWSGLAAAILVAWAGYLLHLHVVARVPGGLAALLTVGELRALYLSQCAALVAGTRYALAGARITVAR